MKRSRQRQVRSGIANKKPLSGSNKQPSDPKEDEEMERKIQDIVAKALEVAVSTRTCQWFCILFLCGRFVESKKDIFRTAFGEMVVRNVCVCVCLLN